MRDLDAVRQRIEQGTFPSLEARVNDTRAQAYFVSFHNDGVHGKGIRGLYSTDHAVGFATGRDPPVVFAVVDLCREPRGVSMAFRWCEQARRFIYDAGDITWKLHLVQ